MKRSNHNSENKCFWVCENYWRCLNNYSYTHIYTVHYVVIQNQFICRSTFLWNINFFNIFLILNILHIICCFIPCSIHDFLYRLRLNFAAIKQIQRGPLCLLPTCSRQSNISCKITCNHGTCLVHTHFSFQGLIPSVIS